MKDYKNYQLDEQTYFVLNGFKDAIYETYEDYKKFNSYKKNELKNLTNDEKQEIEVLVLLEKLGYPMEKMGTYLYKNMIVKIIKEIPKQEINHLLDQITNDYSQFYIDIARNELDMGLKTFHAIIKEIEEKINYDNANKELVFEVLGNNVNNLNYSEKAFVIGTYMFLNLENKRIGREKIKVK